MASVDNIQIFRKIVEPNLENTLYMVYMAERLFSAKGDIQKMFFNLSKLIFDRETLKKIEKLKELKDKDMKFINNRELLIKKL